MEKRKLIRELQSHQSVLKEKAREKARESISAVIPIVLIVFILGFTVAALSPGILVEFLVGSVLVILGMIFFSMGAELSMTPMGEHVGGSMLRTKKLGFIIIIGFILGFIITISEPDLQVLAEQVSSVPNLVLILSVAFSFYILVFVLAMFVPENFLAVAFDSGGVTTGPMTVPFIMALGVGIASIRNDKHAGDDSFGLVALCSIGPILAVLILGLLYHTEGSAALEVVSEVENSIELGKLFAVALPKYFKEIAVSLFPIIAFFGIFQIVSLKLNKTVLIKICIGLFYTYIGLVLFLTGANVGFIPAGNYLGMVLGNLPYNWILVPLGMVIGYFIVKAEPAVYVLMKQVEELTDGAISGKSIQIGLSVGVAVSVGISMLRVLTGISIFYFLVPGYAIALILSLFVPKIFTAIAFDSGGVASGPMTATFLLPLAQGACEAVGGNIVTDAFGVVAMVAMTPLITLQVLGLVYRVKGGELGSKERDLSADKIPVETISVAELFEELRDTEIIEL